MGLRTFLKNWGVSSKIEGFGHAHGTHNEDTTKLLSWFLWLVLTWKCSSPSKTWGFQMHVRRIRIFFICMWWKIEKRDPGKLACLILKVTGEQERPAKCETMVLDMRWNWLKIRLKWLLGPELDIRDERTIKSKTMLVIKIP